MKLFALLIGFIKRQAPHRLSTLGLITPALLISAFIPQEAQAALSSKISVELAAVINASTPPATSFVRDINGKRYVKAIIVATSSQEPNLQDLRTRVLSAGGSVYMNYLSIRALSVLLPAAKVNDVALLTSVDRIWSDHSVSYTTTHLERTAGTSYVRTDDAKSAVGYAGLDGSGIGIAVLDSGVSVSHQSFKDSAGNNRVKRSAWLSLFAGSDADLLGVSDWTVGIDASTLLYPQSPARNHYESTMSTTNGDFYGHGSVVASIAAGRGNYQYPDSTGIAPNANIYSLKILDHAGHGQVSDVLAGIDWVIYHAKEYNIRVLNLSLATDSTESYLNDPLCRAVRSATAAGITVVVAAGNYGKNSSGREVYGSISSPGNDPSVITVGSANTHQSDIRSDDTINFFSSRGPTRGFYTDAKGVRKIDNLIKPDLVAPGNKLIGALSADSAKNNFLVSAYPVLDVNSLLPLRQRLMSLSGTSIAAPVVSGTVALMLQANPGLTPPLIKAILQYSAQPIPGANLLQQGAGLLNVEGAVRLAKALRTDIASAINAGTIAAGNSMLATGQTMPNPVSSSASGNFIWSRIAFVGGNQVLSGSTLFTQFQPIYDPRLVWARGKTLRSTITYWPAATNVPANTFVKAVVEAPVTNQIFITPGVISATALAGPSSKKDASGLFMRTFTLSNLLIGGKGNTLTQSMLLSQGMILSEGLALSEGLILSEGMILSEGLILSEGMILSEGAVLSESALLGE